MIRSGSPQIGLVVTDCYGGGGHTDRDTPAVIRALARQGVNAVPAVWHDEQVVWSGFSAIIVRSPWDYSDRPSAFDDWLNRTSAVTRIFNSPDLIRWNADKRYLDELGSRGIPVIPTRYCDDMAQVERAVLATPSTTLVVKPAVSAGSRNTGLFRHDDTALYGLAELIIAAGKVVMVQPEVPALSAGKERALFYFDGRFSHSVAKGALLAPGGGFLSGDYREDPQPAAASSGELWLGSLTMTVIRGLGRAHQWAGKTGEPPVYARLDVVVDEAQGPLLVEAELFEPALYVHDNPEAARRYATAVVAKLNIERRR